MRNIKKHTPRKPRADQGKNNIILCADTESTTDTGKIWAVAFTRLDISDEVIIEPNLDGLFSTFFNNRYRKKVIIYFHNLKWDGQFIIRYFLDHNLTFTTDYKMPPNTFNALITDMGSYYSIQANINGNRLEIRDSLKLLPFSLEKIGKDFNLAHRKSTMDYDNKKSLDDCSPADLDYIRNDVLVLRDAIDFMYQHDMKQLTIGSCCMQEYFKLVPEATKYWVDMTSYQAPNGMDADMYCRKSYKGGYCYNKEVGYIRGGMTFDVNSLYPSMMNSNRLFPVGEPHFWIGDIPSLSDDKVFIVRFRCRFDLKPNKLPVIQLKKTPPYPGNMWLKTSSHGFSDFTDRPEITLTSVDYKLFLENYDIQDLEILDGCWFDTKTGKELFGPYIEYWAEIKKKSTGAMRQLAKLMLNNLYGKLATNRQSAIRVPYLADNILKYKVQMMKDKETAYLPQATFVTAYGRDFTIRHAQYNIDRLLYIDTDSLHLSGYKKPVNIKEHPSDFECWACEATWDEGYFIRQKTYIEHVIENDRKPVEPYWNIKACGLPKRAKDLFLTKCRLQLPPENLSDDEYEYIKEPCDISDFNVGVLIPVGKLIAKNTENGVVLVNRPFQIRKSR